MKNLVIICIVFVLNCLIIGNVNAQKRSKQFDKGIELYNDGDYSNASKAFEIAFKKTNDMAALYNAGFTALLSKDYDRSSEFLKRCIDAQYYENGEVYAKLADCYMNKNDILQARNILEEGFQKFPLNQSILVSLINLYINTDNSTDRLFTLIHTAQYNDPTNAALYYVEGNCYYQIGDYDKAIAAYEKSNDCDPTYEFGLIGMGVLYYNKALELQENVPQDKENPKYKIIKEEFNAALKLAIPPFEKAFSLSTDENIKISIAEYLKNIYNNLKEDDKQYIDSYAKYARIMENR